ncbi:MULTISPECIES: Bug family tripartite tricarboxylate transporter substrate binding protein [Comamonas]|uniref:Tripartite tricarboxylate transporter substrate binding protein n=1 Tax=Comamonas terrigena TaxID=32013 RepID=A0A2A7UPG3_COMTR|nr:tripartite tricarboxylate transporter substrate binding protein [Comamonas terrigena]MBD9533452.1 tripartite tricarboxylate transporter substrate binding protein [Comamonas sp. CMM01]PEH87219.1 tripartite tricarboxylate transporter substrate binding protein [Comamonas terrigena]PEH90757.1 tripartite tricarboxylate transporter substrate binding protein [Comamonas terrigena]SUY70272.1 Argininosuccinate lyase [Comamonas terrigena]BBL26161.1 MFS transporter [Comamonas terrigena NBRC 13299]
MSITSSLLARRSACMAAVALLAGAWSAPALASNAGAYPNQPIKLIVPFPPGGPTDTAARILGQHMGETLGKPMVVENRAGASGLVGTETAAKSPADGYTLVMLASPTVLGDKLYGQKRYDLLKDFAHIGVAYDLPIVMVVNPKVLDVQDISQLIAASKKQVLNYNSAGSGSFGHLSTELLKSQGKFEMLHISYKGSAPAMTDLLGGQVPMMFSDMIAALPHIKSGKLRPIAVGSPQRVVFTPDVKTVAEQGFPGFDAVAWGGLMAPRGTPQPVMDQLTAALKKALDDKSVQEKLQQVGTTAAFAPGAAMHKRIASDLGKWGKVITDNHITNN